MNVGFSSNRRQYNEVSNKDGTLIGVGESYSTKAACEKSVESVKKFADSATVIEDTTIEE